MALTEGLHAAVRGQLQAIAQTWCVSGNVDEEAPKDLYPALRIMELNGWRILLIHICGYPPNEVRLGA